MHGPVFITDIAKTNGTSPLDWVHDAIRSTDATAGERFLPANKHVVLELHTTHAAALRDRYAYFMRYPSAEQLHHHDIRLTLSYCGTVSVQFTWPHEDSVSLVSFNRDRPWRVVTKCAGTANKDSQP